MVNAAPFTTVCFVLLVLLVLVLVALGLRRAGYRNIAIVTLVVIYLILPGVLARAGALDRYAPLPAPALVLVGVLTLLTALLTLSPFGARLADSVPPGAVIGFQGYRIVVEWLLYRLHQEGVVPVQMTFAGRNWDIVSGVTGLLLGLWILRRGSAPRPLIGGWNLLGLGLLVNIVVTAILSTPVPFRAFPEGPPNLLPSTFPFVWLPSFLVQVALASHLLVFRQLVRSRQGP